MGKRPRVLYNCKKCPAYCCSYPRIIVEKEDLERLASFFGLTRKAARKKFTKKGEEKGERVLRHQKDETYGSVCRFLDPDSRRCTVYEARPEICRDYPGTKRCGYYDFLCFERNLQEDPEFAATAYNA